MVKDLMGSWSSSLFVWRPFGLSQDSLAVELVASRTFKCLGSSGGSEIQEKTWNSLQKLFWLSILKCDFEKSFAFYSSECQNYFFFNFTSALVLKTALN